MGMDEKVPGVVFAASAAVMILTGAYFFTLTGITVNQFLTINTIPLLKEMASINFVLFLVCASFAIGFITAIGRKYLFKYSMLFSLTGTLIGIICALLLFPQLLEFFAPIIVFLLAIPISLKNLQDREHELKYMAVLRSGASAAGRIVVIVCTGFFIYLIAFSVTNKDTLEANFVPELLSYTVGDGPVLSDQFNESLANAMAIQQQQTIEQIQSLDSLKNLQAKNDPDGLALASQLDATKAYVTSNDFKTKVTENLKNQKVDLGEGVMKQLPMMSLFSRYAWIIYPIAALIMTMFIGNLVIRNLSAGVYSFLMRIFCWRKKRAAAAEEKK